MRTTQVRYHVWVAVVALALCCITSLTACGSSASPKALSVTGAWARITGTGGAVYMVVDNPTDTADALTGVSVAPEVAGSAMLHETTAKTGDDGTVMMGMQHAASMAVPAHAKAELKAGGFHIMLDGVKSAPQVGSRIPLTLTFERAGIKTVNAEVRQ